MDVTAASGDVAILYWGHLRALGVRVTWSSLIVVSPDGPIEIRSSLARAVEPARHDRTVHWRHEELAVDARWDGVVPPFASTLFESSRGKIDWACVCPNASARITIGDRSRGNRSIGGNGYAERLEMTIPPWRLPIDTLEWGRALGGDRSLVWIRWRGPQPLEVVLRDGMPTTLAHLDERLVETPTDRVALTPVRTIRDGALARTVLPGIPLPARLLPAAVRDIHETKWLSRADFVSAKPSAEASAPSLGWAIHEIVRFRAEQAS